MVLRDQEAGRGWRGPLPGTRGIGKFWDEWHAVWGARNIIVSEVRSPRDGCVIAFGAFQGIGAGSGIDIERTFGWVFQVENGLIREARTFLSREEALEAAGLRE